MPKGQKRPPIFVAIDTTDLRRAKIVVEQVSEFIGGVKIGLEFWSSHFDTGVSEVAGNRPLFLDLKLFDIPRTVAAAVRALLPLEASYVTVHCRGGEAMMKAAVEAAWGNRRQWQRPMLLGVTLLTSEADDAEAVLALAKSAKAAGLDGITCPGQYLEMVRAELPRPFKIVVPGIRPAHYYFDNDHRSPLLPRAAMVRGADILVIGRPITEATDPAKAAKDILESLNGKEEE